MRHAMKMLNRVNTYIVEPTEAAAAKDNITEVEHNGVDFLNLNLTLEQELEIQLTREKENYAKQKETRTEKNYDKILKQER